MACQSYLGMWKMLFSPRDIWGTRISHPAHKSLISVAALLSLASWRLGRSGPYLWWLRQRLLNKSLDLRSSEQHTRTHLSWRWKHLGVESCQICLVNGIPLGMTIKASLLSTTMTSRTPTIQPSCVMNPNRIAGHWKIDLITRTKHNLLQIHGWEAQTLRQATTIKCTSMASQYGRLNQLLFESTIGCRNSLYLAISASPVEQGPLQDQILRWKMIATTPCDLGKAYCPTPNGERRWLHYMQVICKRS